MGRLFFRVFPAVGLSMFSAALDQTIVATALPAIARDLGEVARVSWIVVLYLIATTIAAPIYGRLGDAFGRRRMLLIAIAVYVSGALVCAASPSLLLLGIGRIWQGFGGGGLISLSVALIAEVVPPRERGSFQAYIAAIFTVASALGPVVGGLLTAGFGWRAVFLIQLPLGIAAAWFAVRRLGIAAPGSRAGFNFDWRGALLMAGFVAPALMALDQARRLTPGPLLAAAGLALVAALALRLLLWQERRAPDPLLPLDVLGNPSIWRTNLLSACVSGAYVGTIAFLPIYFVVVRGLDAASAGFALLPLSAFSGLGAMVAGQMMSRTGYTLRWPGIGLPFCCVLLLVVAAGVGGLPLWLMVCVLTGISLGFGTSFPMVQVTVQVAAGRERLGPATASVQSMRSLGAASGTAMMGAVLFGALTASSGEAAGLFVRLVNEGRGVLDGLPPETRLAFQASLSGAFSAAFAFAALLAGFAGWMCWRVPLQRV